MNKRLVIILTAATILAAALAPTLEAQTQAVVKETFGKVEILPTGGSWQAARVGMSLTRGATISTGFNSTAVLDLGSSVLQVKPLTRMQLRELIQQGGAVSTELFLKVGKVRAEVKTSEGLTQDFKLKSPVSTAAVRGTIFVFEDLIVEVINGQVYFTNLYDQSRTVGDGEQSSIASDGSGLPTSGQQGLEGSSTVGVGGGGGGGPSAPPPTTATVTVQWVWD